MLRLSGSYETAPTALQRLSHWRAALLCCECQRLVPLPCFVFPLDSLCAWFVLTTDVTRKREHSSLTRRRPHEQPSLQSDHQNEQYPVIRRHQQDGYADCLLLWRSGL